jgi:hypothetical protein
MTDWDFISEQRPLREWYVGYREAGMDGCADVIHEVMQYTWVHPERCKVVADHMKMVINTEGYGL